MTLLPLPLRHRALMLVASCAGLSFSQAAPYSVEVLADNPVAYYRLNEAPGATTALDASPHGNHASFAGTVVPTLGADGLTEEADTAAEFSGSSTEKNRVLTPPLFNPALTSFTIEALFKTNGTSQQAVIQQDGGSGRTLFFLLSSGGDIRTPPTTPKTTPSRLPAVKPSASNTANSTPSKAKTNLPSPTSSSPRSMPSMLPSRSSPTAPAR